MSLDGVVQDPDGQEGTERGGWFARRWRPRGGPFADRMNGLPKYVVSGTRESPGWSNATVLRGELVERVSLLAADLPSGALTRGLNRRGQPCVGMGVGKQGAGGRPGSGSAAD